MSLSPMTDVEAVPATMGQGAPYSFFTELSINIHQEEDNRQSWPYIILLK
jgi:hypothetical protein